MPLHVSPSTCNGLIRRSIDLRRLYRHAAAACEPGLRVVLNENVQSLDRLELADALDRRLQQECRAIDVLVQVKTSSEAAKSGLPPEQLGVFLGALRNHHSLRVRGLMTMATHTGEPAEVRRCFDLLRELRDRSMEQGHDLSRLSMGMSGDFPLAVAAGATEVRIGTAIFGRRSPVNGQ